jgi:hypothetical protein
MGTKILPMHYWLVVCTQWPTHFFVGIIVIQFCCADPFFLGSPPLTCHQLFVSNGTPTLIFLIPEEISYCYYY